MKRDSTTEREKKKEKAAKFRCVLAPSLSHQLVGPIFGVKNLSFLKEFLAGISLMCVTRLLRNIMRNSTCAIIKVSIHMNMGWGFWKTPFYAHIN